VVIWKTPSAKPSCCAAEVDAIGVPLGIATSDCSSASCLAGNTDPSKRARTHAVNAAGVETIPPAPCVHPRLYALVSVLSSAESGPLSSVLT
jgi:hypothetical protein